MVLWTVDGVEGQVQRAEQAEARVAAVGGRGAAHGDDGVRPLVAVAQVVEGRHRDGGAGSSCSEKQTISFRHTSQLICFVEYIFLFKMVLFVYLNDVVIVLCSNCC